MRYRDDRTRVYTGESIINQLSTLKKICYDWKISKSAFV